MNRFQKWSASNGMSTGRAIGFLALMGFVLFVAFRIFTPPTEEIQRVTAPDGSREARLMLVYYYSEPGYKVATRTRGLWHTQLYLPEYKGEDSGVSEASIRWSADSKELFLEMNGRPIWSERF